MPNPPKWAKLKPGVSLTLDKSWGQRHCLSAALSGSGVTIGDSFMCLAAISEGRLVAPIKLGLRSLEKYWICRPRERDPTDAERFFMRWLAQEVISYEHRVDQVFAKLDIRVLDAE
ncbi:MAG: hypothetical protein WAT09_03960 [Paracoccaceae bacterium]